MHLSKKVKRHLLLGASAITVALVSVGLTSCSKPQAFKPSKWHTTMEKHPAIHDPSIVMVKDKSGKPHYYVFGTHVT